jgi:tetratricopeptide (TPR) repeat protein
MKYIKYIQFIVLFSFSFLMHGQEITTETVSKESKFIEAKREILIGRYDKGIEILQKLYEEERTNGEVAFELAKAHKAMDQPTMVEKFATTAIKNDPDNLWYQLWYGDYMMEVNRPETAIGAFQKMVEIDPRDPQNYDRLAKAYILVKNYSKAAETYDKMEEVVGSTVDIIMNKFRTYDLMGDYERSVSEIKRLTHKYPVVEDYWLILAQVELKAGNQEKAEAAYKKVLEINPNNSEANLAMLGQGTELENENAYLRSLLPIINNPSIGIDAKVKELLPYVENLAQGKNIELQDALLEAGDRLVQTHNNEAKATALFGDILYNTGNLPAAIKQYEKTLILNDNVYPVWEQLMYALEETEDFDRLRAVSTDALDFYPNQAMVYYFNGVALAKTETYDVARDIMEEGLMVSGNNKVIRSTMLNGLAYSALISNNLEDSRRWLDQSLEVSEGNNPLSIELLGDLYQAEGNTEAALEQWEKSKKMGNNSNKLNAKIEANKS